MEALAIIAYKQPITKGQIEHIRGLSYKYYEGSEKDTSQGKAVWVIVARYDNKGLIDILENLSDVKTVEMCRKKL